MVVIIKGAKPCTTSFCNRGSGHACLTVPRKHHVCVTVCGKLITGQETRRFAQTLKFVGRKIWHRIKQSNINWSRETMGPGGFWSTVGHLRREKYSVTTSSQRGSQVLLDTSTLHTA